MFSNILNITTHQFPKQYHLYLIIMKYHTSTRELNDKAYKKETLFITDGDGVDVPLVKEARV